DLAWKIAISQIPIAPGVKLNKDQNGKLVNCSNYKQLIGSMMYLTTTRPDVMYAISLISRYVSRPTDYTYQLLNVCYAICKEQLTLKYGNQELIGFGDSDYAGCVEDRKSTFGYKLSYKGNNNPVIFHENSSSIKLAKTPVMHGKSKHVDVRFHFLHRLVNDEKIQMRFC
ncbi:hypothetical protein V2J09_013627, partial [Rumex salicifolius]